MDFLEKMQALAIQIPKQVDHVHTEEATKNALVMPFINALGYNVFDPTEVVPEYTADVGTKRGEKVDYAIMRDGEPVMIFECKSADVELGNTHSSQLYRYFSVTPARFGILTNGITYKFFSDLENKNRMDEKPFLIIDMLNLQEPLIDELKKFAKEQFDVDNILSTANELKYTRGIKQIFTQQLSNPDEEFVKFFARKVYSGSMTKSAVEQFEVIVKAALKQVISDRVNSRLQSALSADEVATQTVAAVEPIEAAPEKPETDDGVETTQEETEAYLIVKAILRKTVEAERVSIRDAKSYCGILLDDNNRKPICRLHFNRKQKYLGTFDNDKNETKHPIGSLNDIYEYTDMIRDVVEHYDS